MCPANIIYNTACLIHSSDFNFKRYSKGTGTITLSLEPSGISISMCWPGYAMFGMLDLVMCSPVPSKALGILCSAIE